METKKSGKLKLLQKQKPQAGKRLHLFKLSKKNEFTLLDVYDEASSSAVLAGSGKPGYKDGTSPQAMFHFPLGITFNPFDGSCYVADNGNSMIRRVTARGEVTTYAGDDPGWHDGFISDARFHAPAGIVADPNTGDLYIADYCNHRIRKITPNGQVLTIAGSGQRGSADGHGVHASFHYPRNLDIDTRDGCLYVADSVNNKVRKITPQGDVTTFAGSGIAGYHDGSVSSAKFRYPTGLSVHRETGDIYVADEHNFRIRKISQGVVNTVAGTGIVGASDGPCVAASFRSPYDVKVDYKNDALLVSDYGASKIRRIAQGTVNTISYRHGNNIISHFKNPASLAIDEESRVGYVCEHGAHFIKCFHLDH